MLPYSFDKHPSLPILFIRCRAEYRVSEHLDRLLAEQIDQLNALCEPVTVIVDVREAVHTLEELLLGVQKVAVAAERLLQHHNYLDTIYVTPRRVEQLMAELMNRELLGRQPSRVATTLEDAIAMTLADDEQEE